jgi:hypothetical protein
MTPPTARSLPRLCKAPVVSLYFITLSAKSTRQWLQDRNARNSFKIKLGAKFYPSITPAVLNCALAGGAKRK